MKLLLKYFFSLHNILTSKKKPNQSNLDKSIDPTSGHHHQTTEDMNNKTINPNIPQSLSTANTITVTSTTNNMSTNNIPIPPNQCVKIHNLKQSPLIEFILRKDSRENSVPRLRRECLKVSLDITIQHLKKFLWKKLHYDGSWKDFQLTVNAGGKHVIVDDSITLKQVRGEICDNVNDVMLMLQYFVQPLLVTDSNDEEEVDEDDSLTTRTTNEGHVINGLA